MGSACPLLSDEMAQALDDASAIDTLSLAQVDDTGCEWRGSFAAFEVTLESAVEVPVDDHSGRAYNIDVEPVVEPQDGPGDEAVLLIDTAFEDLGGEGLVYAYFFVLGDRAVTLRATSYEIDPATWRSLADEVAASLEAGAADQLASVAGTREGADEEAAGGDCTFSSIAEMAVLAGFDPATTSVERVGGASCVWTDDSDGRFVDIGATSGFPDGPDLMADRGTDVSARVGVDAYVVPSGGDSVAYVGGADPAWSVVQVCTTESADTVTAVLADLVSRLTDVPG